jgi:O-methyltransferase
MLTTCRSFLRRVFCTFGTRKGCTIHDRGFSRLSDNDCLEIFGVVQPFTMTSYERVLALIDSVQYIVLNEIPGDFVECGVWKGGSIMAAMLTLSRLGEERRKIWLYDTFEGMTSPKEVDISLTGEHAEKIYKEHQLSGNAWCGATAEEVRANLNQCDYPPNLIHFVVGPVEQTLLQRRPSQISLLRLDTDWYESTKSELEMLYPKLARNGVLIVDDYGHWAGCKRAVDEFFQGTHRRPLLHRIDYSGRLVINI